MVCKPHLVCFLTAQGYTWATPNADPQSSDQAPKKKAPKKREDNGLPNGDVKNILPRT